MNKLLTPNLEANLSILQKTIKKKIETVKLSRIHVMSLKQIVIDANTNLNDNYRYGLIPRYRFSAMTRLIEDILNLYDTYDKLRDLKGLKGYDGFQNEYKKSKVIRSEIENSTEQIIYSVGLTKLSYLLKCINSTHFGKNSKFIEMASTITFLDKYVKVINATIEKKGIIKPICIDLNSVNLTPFDYYGTCFLLIPFKNAQAIQIKIHFLKDNLCSFKKEPFFGNKLEDIIKTSQTLNINKNITNRFIDCVLTPKKFMIKTRSEIKSLLFDFNAKFQTYKDMDHNKLIRLFVNRKLIEKAEMITILLVMSLYENTYIHIALHLFNIYNTDTELSNCNSKNPDLWDLLPWRIQKMIRIAKTKIYEQKAENMKEVDTEMSYEQKIQVSKAPERVKRKAYAKLKEINSRQNDSSSKATNWLDGFLKIPFGVYRKEKFIKEFELIRNRSQFLLTNDDKPYYQTIQKRIFNYEDIFNYIELNDEDEYVIEEDKIIRLLKSKTVKQLKQILDKISNEKINKSSLKKSILINKISSRIDINSLFDILSLPKRLSSPEISELETITNKWYSMKDYQSEYMDNIKKSLDKAVYSHDNAKDQIQRIVGQWMTGKSSGYVLGFEGPPGVGKTTMAKYGLANVLKDNNGEPRPFHFLAVGGGCNGSVLEGHSYTYMGSQWGSIVNCLMESKCMNPIIFFDELDKVSNTPHGREIIGILTHLTDSTQNSEFHDKYFNGIDLDLSKALIIFSYNDASSIDPILLDRIHRIKFKEMTLSDKLVVIKEYLIPSICKEIGLDSETIIFKDDLLEFIINSYTLEPGVRKIKQILYDIYRDININILKDNIEEFPYVITKEYVTDNILKKYPVIHPLTIKGDNKIGVINGMYATRSGFGGILQIESKFVCDTTPFKLLLTGSLKDVMLESMQIAKNVALELLPSKIRSELTKKILKKDNIMKGIHIHCPEGAVPKDGPSAGQAITLCLYSLFTGKKIPDNFSFTGEICLSGDVMRVGGISSKVMGSLRAGVRNIILPKENKRDYEIFREEVLNLPEHKIYFVSNIKESMKILWG
jgi:ATP-dependent Lon protease